MVGYNPSLGGASYRMSALSLGRLLDYQEAFLGCYSASYIISGLSLGLLLDYQEVFSSMLLSIKRSAIV